MNQTLIFTALKSYLVAFKNDIQSQDVYEATLVLIQGALSQAAVIQFVNHLKEQDGSYFLREDVDIDELWGILMDVSS